MATGLLQEETYYSGEFTRILRSPGKRTRCTRPRGRLTPQGNLSSGREESSRRSYFPSTTSQKEKWQTATVLGSQICKRSTSIQLLRAFCNRNVKVAILQVYGCHPIAFLDHLPQLLHSFQLELLTPVSFRNKYYRFRAMPF